MSYHYVNIVYCSEVMYCVLLCIVVAHTLRGVWGTQGSGHPFERAKLESTTGCVLVFNLE